MTSRRRRRKRKVALPHSTTALAPPSFPSRPKLSIPIDRSSEDPLTVENDARCRRGKKLTNQRQLRQAISIDILPDDALLKIFDFYVNEKSDGIIKKAIEKWQTLVHVCRQWRSVVFGSPRRLDLRLVYSATTPARDTLGVWPSLPLIIRDTYSPKGGDDIIAVLERSDRVVDIDLFKVDNSELEPILAAMHVPFPELTRLALHSSDGLESVLPDSFLGGSTPRLRSLRLHRIPFPGLPKLLLSATCLVYLFLDNIPHPGYISPEAIVTVLSTLASLDCLFLRFESPRSCPDSANRRLPPSTRSVLPALTTFRFKGACEYLEDLMICIDAPRLNLLFITLFNQIVFDTPQFTQFISRSPALDTFKQAFVVFGRDAAMVCLTSGYYRKLNMTIPCIKFDWQVSSMEQVCNLCLPPLSSLEDLHIHEYLSYPYYPVRYDNIEDIEDTLWLEILRPFTGVKNLYLSETFASLIIPALQELTGGTTTEVLPILQSIFLAEPEGERQPSGTVEASIRQFAATRQATGHPIAVSRWDNSKKDMEINSYSIS